MSTDRRKNGRVEFERGFPAIMAALDRSWQRHCLMDDVSDGGARLKIKESVEGLNLKEFILLLSANGQAFRRCELSWVKDDEIAVRFVKFDPRRRAPSRMAEPPDSAPLVEI